MVEYVEYGIVIEIDCVDIVFDYVVGYYLVEV